MPAKVTKDTEELATLLYEHCEKKDSETWREIPDFQKEHYRKIARAVERRYGLDL